MEIIGIILLIVIIIVLTYMFKHVFENWIALAYSIVLILVIMSATVLITENKSHEGAVKEYLQHPERYSIKVISEDSIPIDTIVEFK
jgi:undecaprenyl pyrophosphate phosphatase UppP